MEEEDYSNELLIFFVLLAAIPVVVVTFFTILSLTVVKQKEVMIVERWGKFHAKWEAGFHFLIPVMDRPRLVIWREYEITPKSNKAVQRKISRIDLRQNIMDFMVQTIITRDNVEIGVHPMLVYEIVDPIRLAYETFDLQHAVAKLVQTTLRSIIGDMGLDDTLASREEINRGTLQKIQQVCLNWGIEICRVELLEIIPTPSVQQAMHNQLSAERLRRAAIVTAEGYREKVKTEAEGNCQATIALATGAQQSAIIKAKAKADAKILIARAEATALSTVGEALRDMDVDATQYMVALKYMNALRSIACAAEKRTLLLPFETNIVGATDVISQ